MYDRETIELDREMGIGFSKERAIESVTAPSILSTARSSGIPESMAANILRGLQEKLPDALSDGIRELDSEVDVDVASIGDKILDDARTRCAPR